MAVINGWRREARARPGAVDALVSAVLFGLSVVASAVVPDEHRISFRWPGVVLAAVGCAALMWRRRHPFGVLAVAVGCGVAFQVLGFRESPLVSSPVVVSLYTVAVRTDRRTTWTTAAATAAVLVGAALLFTPGSWLEPEKAVMLAWTALAAAIGDAVRSRHAYVAAVEERAEHAERTREQEAQQRVAAERVRIARELHDVVAHHIALINAQAGVAVHLAERQPEQTLAALENIRDTSRSALDELRATVGLLRQTDDPAAPRDPMPGLTQLPDLLASFEGAGLAVRHSQRGISEPLAPAVDLAAYRIVQEALTNVHKHAGADHARLFLHYRPEWLTITVEDDGCVGPYHREPHQGTGHGLIGMRERAAIVGGTLYAGARPQGGFAVTADLPLRAGTATGGPTADGPQRRDGYDDPRTASR
ncbi:sensor histidine kinase [Streptomyces sp. NBC_00121]|uniref:sensor histidine kinase n=1 Tax=unclassified Streptomyces TaxID=2593676 RepID=UPI0028C3D2EA|nr:MULTISPECIES: sensor histidine kinase [unclassified Streptomyces]WNO63422.1 sensor histidine kinase [Streptomyces sp. AM2-3-1]WSC68001.1 sensor histidine kinase [Streptomyces sp. NBC_01760]WTE58384.1 sensor histidine kinase [Streptomyces sp. NBC_01617]WTI85907.1 sensor histidine kinase [Streptomyces sp. NBC_00724]